MFGQIPLVVVVLMFMALASSGDTSLLYPEHSTEF